MRNSRRGGNDGRKDKKMVKAEITITKTFDESRAFSKTWEMCDFEEFMKDEGQYLDKLADTLEVNGKTGEGFTVTYTVSATKE